mgnify:FL=1|tara:strand:- start:6962 stop:7456 length:495 start_codon:yes stop_codon:yes gene_type:complete
MGSARTSPGNIETPEFKKRAENLKNIPEGSERSMAFMGLMADSIGGGIMGRTGRATMTGDVGAGPFKKFTDKAEQDKEETREVTSSQSSDFDMDKVRERLLAQAKEDRAANQQRISNEKQIYNTSLPKGFDPRKEGLLKTMEAAGATKGSGNPFKPFQNRASGV